MAAYAASQQHVCAVHRNQASYYFGRSQEGVESIFAV